MIRAPRRLAHERMSSKNWLGSQPGLQTARSKVKERGRPIPFQRVRVYQASRAFQECLRSSGRLVCDFLVPYCGTGNCREEHARVDLERSLAKLLPVNHAGAVPHIEDVTCIEGAVHEVWRSFPRLGPRQYLCGSLGGGPEEWIGRGKSPDGHPHLIQKMTASPRRAEPGIYP